MNRNILIGFTALALPAAVIGCAGQTITATSVIADARSVVQGLGNAVTQIAVSQPNLLPAATVTQIKGYLADADTLLGALQASDTDQQAAAVLQRVMKDVESVLSALATVKDIPPQYQTIIQAASVVAPIVDQFIIQTLGTLNFQVSAHAPSGMSVGQARAILHSAAP